MIVALLFDENDRLIAAAPACDWQPLGDRYWREVYPQPLTTAGTETAAIEIKPGEMLDCLLSLANHPESLELCRQKLAAFEKKQAIERQRRAHAA